jgi:putative tryptophan/tyrosine transport system substrate-binding protein
MWYSAVGCIAILILSLLVVPLTATAQPLTTVPRIGWLGSGFPPSDADRQRSPFLQGLRELGWVEGQNIAMEWRYAEENADRLPALAAELVQLRVDVIVAGDSGAQNPARQATSTIPIVMMISADHYVASLARPGGNITGLTNISPELAGKRLELLKEAVPGMARLAVLGPPNQRSWPETAVAARALGLQLHTLQIERPDEYEQAFAAATRERAEALIVLPSPSTNRYRRQIVNLAAQSRLPAMYALKEYVEVGGLMAYGPSIPALSRRAATYVHKILQGAKPADLPVEQPMRFEFVINLKTAQTLGLTLPPHLLFFADEVIQ